MPHGAMAASDGDKIHIGSGTGFIVSRNGYIVTNLHVVSYCQRIWVQGAVAMKQAELVGRDVTHDLALLKIGGMGLPYAKLRSGNLPLEVGETALTIGYPGSRGMQGKQAVREAQITDLTGPWGEEEHLQISSVIEQGNSGGPLLDSAGNVIGVIVAEAVSYRKDGSALGIDVTKRAGIAIALQVLKEFLADYRVNFGLSDKQEVRTAQQIAASAQRFIVHIRCETPTEVR